MKLKYIKKEVNFISKTNGKVYREGRFKLNKDKLPEGVCATHTIMYIKKETLVFLPAIRNLEKKLNWIHLGD